MSSYDRQFQTLNDIGRVARGKSKHRPRNDPKLYGGKFPFIQTGDVKHSNFYITKYSQTYNEKGLAQSKLWEPGTLCITIAANIADTAILTFPACFPDSIIGFIPDKEKADVKFVKYCLDTYKQQMQSISRGTTQDNLSQGKLLSIKIKFPPLKTQQKIAAVLSAYDDLLENNKHRITLLEKMAEEIYREWFVRMRFSGHEKTKFVKGVPEGWVAGKISDASNFKYGFTESALYDNDFPKFLRVMDINKRSFVKWSDVPNCPIEDAEFLKYSLNEGDILIARMADPGKVAIIEEKVRAVFASYLIKIEYDRTKVTPYFFFYTLKSDYHSAYFSGADSGATRGSINAGTIGNSSFVYPGLDLMKLFDLRVSELRSQMVILNKINDNLVSTRDMLLPRLISGKLSVEKLDIQFPPSMKEDITPEQVENTHA